MGKAKTNEPQPITVELPDGVKLVVGPISWGGYKAIRRLMIEALSGSGKSAVEKVVGILGGLDLTAADAGEKIAGVCEAAGVIDDLLVDAWPLLIRSCVAGAELGDEFFDNLSAADFLTLTAAASKMADIPGLMALEGNCVFANLPNGGGMAKTKPTANPPTGTNT